MIMDILEQSDRYMNLNKGFKAAFDFLKKPDLKSLEPGKYVIDSDRVYATVARGQGRKKEDARLETHDCYIDIQLILDGTDEMGWKPASACHEIHKEYDPETDIRFFEETPDAFITVSPGMFVVFYPEDAHMPMISSGEIRKVVVKVAVDLI